MRSLFAAFVLIGSLLLATPAIADSVTLRDQIQASGPAITLGDVFNGAGDAAGRAIAPAPPAGQSSTLSPALLAAAASAAGLDWTPPPGLAGVPVTRTAPRQSSGLRATVPISSSVAQNQGGAQTQFISARASPDAVVHRGDTVSLGYAVPGLQLTARARAL